MKLNKPAAGPQKVNKTFLYYEGCRNFDFIIDEGKIVKRFILSIEDVRSLHKVLGTSLKRLEQPAMGDFPTVEKFHEECARRMMRRGRAQYQREHRKKLKGKK